ncbi:MAG TPA: mandelate racemase/muconate lactonizing enzyme family protein, partial [Casimicrobiaceae bacterium]|nr:mandelate racemase/muconate lactonizing enzyme family protein [Casimicrobiaceae bacterium]
MIPVAALRCDFYRVPLPTALTDSTHGAMHAFELVTVRLTDADGAEGVGYTYTVGTGGGAIHSLIVRDLAPVVIGSPAENIEALWQKMWWTVHYGGRGGQSASAISAIDIALWDLKARRAALPLYQALGGYDARVPCYAGGIDLDLGIDALLAQTEDNLRKGFRAIKMKVGRPKLSEDLARIEAMRHHLGAEFPLMVDANMRWSVDQAIQAARAMQRFDLTWLEEPTIPDDVAGHARIVRDGGVPIAAGENLHTLHEFAHYLRMQAVTFPEPDVTNCGGVTVFMKVAHL